MSVVIVIVISTLRTHLPHVDCACRSHWDLELHYVDGRGRDGSSMNSHNAKCEVSNLLQSDNLKHTLV